MNYPKLKSAGLRGAKRTALEQLGRPMAVDVIAQAIRAQPRTTGAGALAEHCMVALLRAGYVVIKDRTDPEGGYRGERSLMGRT